jgi:hypothetical protein
MKKFHTPIVHLVVLEPRFRGPRKYKVDPISPKRTGQNLDSFFHFNVAVSRGGVDLGTKIVP